MSAKYGHGVDDVKEWILSKLPHGPAYYPKVCMRFTYGIDSFHILVGDVYCYLSSTSEIERLYVYRILLVSTLKDFL